VLSAVKTKFEQHWYKQVRADNQNHNKLRTYSTLKHRFGEEPYINLVRNRNQRMHLTRLRTSAHNLGIERGRYKNLPFKERFCSYCSPSHGTTSSPQPGTPTTWSPPPTPRSPPQASSLVTEFHLLIQCPTTSHHHNQQEDQPLHTIEEDDDAKNEQCQYILFGYIKYCSCPNCSKNIRNFSKH
jgi:hypothetical protein